MRRQVWQTLRVAAFAGPVVITANDMLFSFATMEGSSMAPALNPASSYFSDHVLLDKLTARVQTLQRGDVVLSLDPEDADRTLIKRLVGLPGDWLRDTSGKMVHVPRGRCWLEDDNREASRDSNAFGPVPLAMVTARVHAVWWPPNRIGTVQRKGRDDGLDIWPDT